MKIKIVSDLKQVNRRLEKLKNMHDSTFLTGKIAHDMKKEVALRFRNQEDKDGKAWANLSANTIFNRYYGKKRKGTAKILQNTGRLRNSISAGNTRTKAIVGTNLIYAPTHQFGVQGRVISAKNKTRLAFYTVSGFRRPKQVKINIPARPFMGLSEKQKTRYREWIKKWKRGELS